MKIELDRRCPWCREKAVQEASLCAACGGATHVGNAAEVPAAPRRVPGAFHRRSWLRTTLSVVGLMSLPDAVQDSALRHHEANVDEEPSNWLGKLEHGRAVLARVVTSAEDAAFVEGQHGWTLELEVEDGPTRFRRRVVTRDVGNARLYSEGAAIVVIDDGAGGWMLFPPLLDTLHLPTR